MAIANNIRDESAYGSQAGLPPISNYDNGVALNIETNATLTFLPNKKLRKCANQPICTSLSNYYSNWNRAHRQFYKNSNLHTPVADTFNSPKR